ncbi:protein phosphatase 2C domain-containing protein [Streptomyces zaomyceticus]|uniref:protein phosphatase 2C domain-containing protein n=1 Tax=Streptomyces zaomyceticus TaxID=68286 RepID=UPI003990808F
MKASAFSSASPGRANEDFATWDDQVAVVVDGAGMPDSLAPPCIHGVSWFARALGAALRTAASGSGTLRDALAEAIVHTAGSHASTCSVHDPLSPSATVAALRLRHGSVEWLVLGDCTLILDRGGFVQAISDTRLATVAQHERAAMHSAPPGSNERRRLHARLVQAERALRNQPGGYWVAAADPQAAEAALSGSAPARDVARAALMTDGAARYETTLALADWPTCLDILEREGPDSLIRRVREAEFSDSALTRWPRSKPHDDATVVYVPLSSFEEEATPGSDTA